MTPWRTPSKPPPSRMLTFCTLCRHWFVDDDPDPEVRCPRCEIARLKGARR